MIMTHADDDGLVLPPKLAPQHVVILPIFRSRTTRSGACSTTAASVAAELARSASTTRRCACSSTSATMRGGEKVWQWVKKGVPLRLEIGPRDIDKDAVFVGRRDTRAEGQAERAARRVRRDDRRDAADRSRTALLARARAFRNEHTRRIDTPRRVLRVLRRRRSEGPKSRRRSTRGFAMTHFSGDAELEAKIKDDLS